MIPIRTGRAQAECQVWQDILKSANQYLAQKRAASESAKEKTLADWLHHLDERWQASAELAERTLLSSSSTDEDTRLQEMLRDVHHDVSPPDFVTKYVIYMNNRPI